MGFNSFDLGSFVPGPIAAETRIFFILVVQSVTTKLAMNITAQNH